MQSVRCRTYRGGRNKKYLSRGSEAFNAATAQILVPFNLFLR